MYTFINLQNLRLYAPFGSILAVTVEPLITKLLFNKNLCIMKILQCTDLFSYLNDDNVLYYITEL